MVQNITEKEVVALHEKTKVIVKKMNKNEAELVLSLRKIIEHKVYLQYKYPSLFSYLTIGLGLSESRAYDFSVVARACLKFEKLNHAVANGKISVSKARRITPVLTKENEDHWLATAGKSTHRQLEKLVAAKNPEAVSCEGYKYISANQIEVKITMTLAEFNEFKRAQDLLCQKMKKQVSMRGTLSTMSREFLKRNDPVIRASKMLAKKNKLAKRAPEPGTSQVRKPIPAYIQHLIHERDKGRCQAIMPHGTACNDSKWVDLHHLKPVYQGGDNSIQNLITLCKGHHQMEHQGMEI